MRFCVNGLHRCAAHLEGKEAGGVGDLFREVHLEVADNFSALSAPIGDSGESGVFERVDERSQDVVERPSVEMRRREQGVGGHRWRGI